MAALQYETWAEAKNRFQMRERWEVFDRDREHLNIAHECVDRHRSGRAALRIQNSDGTRCQYSFEELSGWSSQFANLLERRGVKAGDRVAVVLGPSLEYYVSFFGILKQGAVVVPCYPLLGREGIEYRFHTAGVKAAIIGRDVASGVRLESSPRGIQALFADGLMDSLSAESWNYETRTSSDGDAVIQFTSGTTGQPRPLFYKHGAMSLTAVYARMWLGLLDGDVYVCTSSPAWGHGIWYGTVGPMIFGNGIGAYSGRFVPEVFLDGMQAYGVTVGSCIPRVYKMIMACGRLDDYELKVRRLTYAGDSIDREVQEYFQDKLGLVIASCYGNTEAGPVAMDFAYPDYEPRLGSAGRAVIGTTIGILDEGGEPLPAGEIGRIAVWRNGAWSPIGDYGYLDKDGYLFPKGRSDDIIKSSGYRIGPFEVESVLEKHPAVQKAAVVGSPDRERGEIVKAFVILGPGFAPAPSLIEDLKSFVRDRLSLHEYPREIEFVDGLPETTDGKLQRRKLKDLEYERARARGFNSSVPV